MSPKSSILPIAMDVFEQVDKDGSGEISVSELADMLLLEDLSEALGDKKPNSKKEAVSMATKIMKRLALKDGQNGFSFDEWGEFLECLQEIVRGDDEEGEVGTSNPDGPQPIHPPRKQSNRTRRHSITVTSKSQRLQRSTITSISGQTTRSDELKPGHASPSSSHRDNTLTTISQLNTSRTQETPESPDMMLRYKFEALQAGQEAINERRKNQLLMEQLEHLQRVVGKRWCKTVVANFEPVSHPLFYFVCALLFVLHCIVVRCQKRQRNEIKKFVDGPRTKNKTTSV